MPWWPSTATATPLPSSPRMWTTIYVKNSATKAGVGIGGEGHCTMTIAGPTGEGITCAKSFCRRRRCMLAEGGLRII